MKTSGVPPDVQEDSVHKLWRNLRSLLPTRRYDPFRYGSDPHTSPWADRVDPKVSELREIIDSGEIKQGPWD